MITHDIRNEEGIGAYAIRTQQEVADMMGISKQYVQQIEAKLFRKLRNKPVMKELYREVVEEAK